MKFSIIITTYNQPQYLSEAVESCFNQTYKEPFEVIIIDDFSNSCATVNIPDRSEIDLLYAKNDKNLGLAKSHNIGVYYSTGEWVIRLDHDDRLLPDALQKLSDFINTEVNKKIGFIYSDLMIMGTNQVRKYPEWKSGSILDLQNIGHLQCYRRDKTLEIGGWDTTLAYSADTDFIIRLIEHSVQLKHIPEVLVENRLHPEQYTQKWVREGNNPQFWKNLIFNRALQRRPDLWVEGRQQTIMQTSGSHLWRSETEFINNFLKTQSNMLNGLDIGCSNKKKINFAVGIDQDRNGGKTPELVWDGTKELPFRDGTLDFICASHCIEHIKGPIQAIQDWGNKLRTGGLLLLIVPHKKYIPNMGTPEGDPTHVADYLPQDFNTNILSKLLSTKWKIRSFDKINNNWSFDCFLEKV